MAPMTATTSATPPARTPASLLLLLALTGCPPAEPPDWCEGPTRLRFDPDGPLSVYPDDHLTEPDPGVATGLRVAIDPQDDTILDDVPEVWRSVFADLDTLDGWGTTGATVLRFDGPVDPASITPQTVRMVAFGPDGVEAIPLDLRTGDGDRTVFARPLVALPSASRAATVVTTGATDPAGVCLSPPDLLRDPLTPGGADPFAARFAEALAALELQPAEVAALTVFTTQSTTAQSVQVAADVAARDYAVEPATCQALDGGRWRCDATVRVFDYRDEQGHVPLDFDAEPQGDYLMPISVWYPGAPADGPYPVAIGGHGLNSTRFEVGGWAAALAPSGIAVVGNPAVSHGEHPRRDTSVSSLIELVRFFGLGPGAFVLDPIRLRDNFRQSAWDRLQVAQAIAANPDLDGDGAGDFLVERLGYVGASLGGMVGTECVALSDLFAGAALPVAGGRFEDIVTFGEQFAPLLDGYVPDGASRDDLVRLFPLFQAIADAGDPMTWGRALVRDPVRTGPAPQLLLQYAWLDDTVNNVANANHAQSIGVPLVGREVWPMPVLERLAGPVQGNLPGGGTGAVQLIDDATNTGNPGVDPTPTSHGSMPFSYEVQRELVPFLVDVLRGRPATLDDPYRPVE